MLCKRYLMEVKLRLLRGREVTRLTGYNIATIWRLEKLGQFPSRVRLNDSGTRVAWREEDIDRWIESRIAGFGRPVRQPEPVVRRRVKL
jgi:predicted DNA-binding transcriptional regulator AlpA